MTKNQILLPLIIYYYYFFIDFRRYNVLDNLYNSGIFRFQFLHLVVIFLIRSLILFEKNAIFYTFSNYSKHNRSFIDFQRKLLTKILENIFLKLLDYYKNVFYIS